MVLLLYKFHRIHKITFKTLFVPVIFLFSFGLATDIRNGLLNVNSGKTSHSHEISKSSNISHVRGSISSTTFRRGSRIEGYNPNPGGFEGQS